MSTQSVPFVVIPRFQVKPWGLLAYDRVESLRPRIRNQKRAADKIVVPGYTPAAEPIKQYTGQLTPYAKKKLTRAIQLMVASAKDKEAPNFKTGTTFKFKVNFITMTLPCPQGDVTDKELKKFALDNFIKRLKRKYGLQSYVWRAERQKNGNLHFHMITDCWMHYEKLRNDWNAVLNRFGFIDQFQSKHGHRNPNSTDIHAVWKVKNLTQYFVKYMSKDSPEQDTIEGKLWDCSANLKTKQNCEFDFEPEVQEIWNKAFQDPQVKTKVDQHFALIFLSPGQFDQFVTGSVRDVWHKYLDVIHSGSNDFTAMVA